MECSIEVKGESSSEIKGYSTNRSMVTDFPLQVTSQDFLVTQKVDYVDHTSPQAVGDDEYKLYLKLLQLSSSKTQQIKSFLGSRKIPQHLINKLDDSQGAASLHYASMNGNLQMVTFLLENAADVDIWDRSRKVTPLICAAAFGHLEIVEALLESKCIINIDTNNSSTHYSALLWAVRVGHPEVARCLLNHKACQNSTHSFSETPIHAAVISGSPEILEMLINAQGKTAKADFQMGDELDTPLHMAASAEYPNSLKLCKILLDQGNAQVNSQNASKKTPLHIAAASYDHEILELLLSHWANVNAVDQAGRTPLFYAVNDAENALKCLDLLLVRGKCNVNHQDIQGYTALHFAGIYGAVGAAEVLLMNGADFSIKGNDGISALGILRRDIPDTIYILRNIFDKAITTTNASFQNSSTEYRMDCKVKVNFKCVIPSSKTDKSASQEQPVDQSHVTNCPDVMTHIHEKPDRFSPRKETAKIKCLVAEEHSSLLSHPLIHSFLELKWQKAKYIIFPTLAFKAILVILISVYGQLPYVFNYDNSNESVPTCYIMDYSEDPSKMIPASFIFLYALTLSMAVIKITLEIMHIFQTPKAQLRKMNPLVSTTISLAVLIIMVVYMQPEIWYCMQNPLRRSIVALGILLAWIDVWIDMSRLPRIGLSIRVFIQVFKTFSLFVIPHICLYAGFVLSFTLLFPQSGEFVNVYMGMPKVVRVMGGDVPIVPEGVRLLKPEDPLDDKISYLIVVYIYTAYVLIVAIVLMNLFIGLAVNDIKGIYAEASIDKLVKQTIILNTLESSFHGKWIRRWMPQGFYSNYLDLFNPSSQSKIFTCKPYDSRDCLLSTELKMELLNIGSANKMKTSPDVRNSVAITPKTIHMWRKAVNKLRGSKIEEEQRMLMDSINELVSAHMRRRKMSSTRVENS